MWKEILFLESPPEVIFSWINPGGAIEENEDCRRRVLSHISSRNFWFSYINMARAEERIELALYGRTQIKILLREVKERDQGQETVIT